MRNILQNVQLLKPGKKVENSYDKTQSLLLGRHGQESASKVSSITEEKQVTLTTTCPVYLGSNRKLFLQLALWNANGLPPTCP
jgi:hypothetical protein